MLNARLRWLRAHSLLLDIADLVGGFYLRKWFLPSILRTIWTLWHYRRYLWAALRSLARPRLDVPVLDASAIGVSLVQADPATAAETMFLLDFEETLEDYTRALAKRVDILAAYGPGISAACQAWTRGGSART